VATQIHGPSVLLKHLIMQATSEKDIREMAVWEAEQVFSVESESIIVDCVMGDVKPMPGAPKGHKGREVVLVGVRTEEAQQLHRAESYVRNTTRGRTRTASYVAKNAL
jgi:hypothetical protein